jgi:hypothetical protein
LKVNFFIVGTQKGGTTALHSMLSCLNGIQMSTPKEIHFFDNEEVDWHQPDYEKLHTCFDWNVENQIRGEATPIYCYWPESLRRIHAYNPEAKIIMLLRHPAHRAYSHWRMEFLRGYETLQFVDAISEKGRWRVAGAPEGVHRIYSYVERGFYSKQINRLKHLFCNQKIIFLRTDELWSAPKLTLEKVARFLGAGFPKETSSNYVAPSFNKLNDIALIDKSLNLLFQLTNLFKEDIRETERLTNIPLSDWLDPDYTEPMARP